MKIDLDNLLYVARGAQWLARRFWRWLVGHPAEPALPDAPVEVDQQSCGVAKVVHPPKIITVEFRLAHEPDDIVARARARAAARRDW